jgi:hypothetical protein
MLPKSKRSNYTVWLTVQHLVGNVWHTEWIYLIWHEMSYDKIGLFLLLCCAVQHLANMSDCVDTSFTLAPGLAPTSTSSSPASTAKTAPDTAGRSPEDAAATGFITVRIGHDQGDRRPVFYNMVCPQGWTWPLGVNLATRGELGHQVWNLSPRGNVHPFVHPSGGHSAV